MNYAICGKHRCNVIILILVGLFWYQSPVYGESKMPAGTNQFKLVNGMAIYIGVVPAEMLAGHNASNMHGGVPIGNIRLHLTAAIFDEKTGKRISNAKIKAQIFSVPEKTGFRELEPMEYGKVLVYGNYFSLDALGPYMIRLHIEHKSLQVPIEVEFQYQSAYARLSSTLVK